MRDLTCYEVADSAPGFALDILDPQVRSRVAAHLIRCPDCRQSVSTMQDSAAELLDVGHGDPWEEPVWPAPPATPALRPARRRFRTAVSVAAAAVLFVGSTLGPEIAQASRTGEKPIMSAALIAGNQPVGTVHVFGGHSPAIALQVDRFPATGSFGVVLTANDGTSVKLGDVEISHGHAAWIGSNPVRSARPTGVILVDSDLHQVASAAL